MLRVAQMASVWARSPATAIAMTVGILVVGASSATGAGLPDHRGYELVSPQDKNGADVMRADARTRAAADGSAVQFSSLTGFGDVRGTGIGVDYMAVRGGRPGTSGWSTHALTPPNLRSLSPFETAFGGLDPRYMGEFAANLDKGMFLSHTALTNDSPFTDVIPNIYMRDDLRTPGVGHYRLVSGCPGCTGPLPASPADQAAFAGASADFSHIVFESPESLTADVVPCDPGLGGAGCPIHLYEWASGVVRLAGILPASEGGGPAPSSQGGGAMYVTGFPASYTNGVISRDGTRIVFGAPTGLYMRVGNGTPGALTIRLNDSERDIPDATPLDAHFGGATPDGMHAFFTTNENLVEADNSDENFTDLYEYNVTADAQGHHLRLISVDSEPSDGVDADVDGLLGFADDARYVYFISHNQLEAGQPTGNANRIFVWHDGEVREVGDVTQDVTAILGAAGWRIGAKTSRVASDGAVAVFLARSGTVELPHSGATDDCDGAIGGCTEMYVYNAAGNGGAGNLTCASCHEDDPQAASHSNATFLAVDGLGNTDTSAVLNHPITNDGHFVFFSSGDRLVPEDKNNESDVYEYDTAEGRVKLLSSGSAESLGSTFLDASTSGDDVFFATRDQLVGWDIDQQFDLYDARVDGGLPNPPVSRVGCSGSTCRAAQLLGRSFAAPASSAFGSVGNVRHRKSAAKHCGKGRVRRRVHGRVKCVQRSKHRRAVYHGAGQNAVRRGR